MSGPGRLRVKGILFDVDGTLAGSVELFYEVALEVLHLAGLPPRPRDEVYALMRIGHPSPLEQLFPPDYPDVVATLQRIRDSRMDEWLRRYHEETEAIPGSVALLHDLHGRGIRLGIATSSGRALPFLDTWGVRHLFDAIVGREDVQHHKPHPEPLVTCLAALRLDPGDAVYVGDSPIDIQAGKAAGLPTVGVLTGTSPAEILHGEGADYVLPSVAELPGLLSPCPSA